MKSKIDFSDEFPQALRADASQMAQSVEWMLPIWIQRLWLGYDSQTEAQEACFEIMPDYRWAKLTFSARFWACSDRDKQLILLHEMIHAFNLPLINAAREIVDTVCKPEEETLKAVLHEKLREKMEMVTQDFAYVLQAHLNDDDN